MKTVIQRVSSASVEVAGKAVSSIGKGFLVLVGIEAGDGPDDVAYLTRKVAGLRVFPDQEGKMNLSLAQTGGECLVVSQFTLAADTTRGNRPGFERAASPAEGERLYEEFASALAGQNVAVKKGVFRAHMKVALVNDGPVTILIDSAQRGA